MSALPPSRPPGRRARRLAGSLATGAVVLTTALASSSLASAQSSVTAAGAQASTPESSTGTPEARGYYDARYGRSSTAKAIAARGASKAASRGATRAFAKSLLPHIDVELMKKVQSIQWLRESDGRINK